MIHGTECTDQAAWDELVHSLDGHPLQLWGWGELKGAHNWQPHRIIFANEEGETAGAAQLLERTLPAPFGRLLYVPRGPVASKGREEEILAALAAYVRIHLPGTVLTVEPDAEAFAFPRGWRSSSNTILIPRTLILDLTKSEPELLESMTKKTRQYIRKSGREGLTVKRVKTKEALEQCMTIYHQTAERAGFPLHGDQYYYDVHEKLGDSSVVFAVYKDDRPLAFLWLAASSQTAFELYGGMNDEGQALRANYMLKWHAITQCREWGIERYDMNGLLNDGVSTFKQGFASHENMLVGTYDYALSPLYPIWTQGLPFAKKLLRKLKSLRK
jgi:lipid II:glycine glycyltransferase (peptidoglycan interpeptide bridge formation enzyme)